MPYGTHLSPRVDLSNGMVQYCVSTYEIIFLITLRLIKRRVRVLFCKEQEERFILTRTNIYFL